MHTLTSLSLAVCVCVYIYIYIYIYTFLMAHLYGVDFSSNIFLNVEDSQFTHLYVFDSSEISLPIGLEIALFP